MRRTIFLLTLLAAGGAMAHPGGLDANGGHVDRKTGIYHYHRKTNAPAGDLPVGSNSIATTPGAQIGSASDPSSNGVSLPTDVETNGGENADLQDPDTAAGVVAPRLYLPWWVYLIGLGCGYAIWELCSFYHQKSKNDS